MKRHIKLIHTTGGHNKYYEMEYDGTASQFHVKFGRIGAGPQRATYHISDWTKKLNEKLKKGYVDVSENVKTIEEILADLDARIEAMETREVLKKVLAD